MEEDSGRQMQATYAGLLGVIQAGVDSTSILGQATWLTATSIMGLIARTSPMVKTHEINT